MPARPEQLRVLRQAITAFAAANGATEDALHAIALGVSEAATNAVLHAYVGMDPGSIRVRAEARAGEIWVAVADEGRGMQPRIDSPGMGAGLPTIGQLTTSMDVRSRPGGRGTEVRMTFAAPGVEGLTVAEHDVRAVRILGDAARMVHGGGWSGAGLQDLAALLVSELADAAVIDLCTDDGAHQRVAQHCAPGTQGLLPAPGETDPPDSGWWLSTPMRDGQRTIALLGLGGRPGTERPDAETEVLVEQIAAQVVEAFAAARLLEQAARSRRRLERILGVLAEAVTVSDANGRVHYANQAAVDLLGAGSVEEVVQARPGELASRFVNTKEDGTEPTVHDLPGRQILAGEQPRPLLLRTVHKASGRARWTLTKASLLDGDEPLAVNVIEDVTEAKEAELRWRFLSGAGQILASSLDYERTLEQVAWLAVPRLADWCAVDVLEGEELKRVAVAHVDPEKLALGRLLHDEYPPDLDSPEGVGAVLRTGKPYLLPDLPDEMLVEGAKDERHLALLRRIGLRSAVIAPLLAGDRVTGMVSFVTAESRRTYGPSDVELLQDLAGRASVAVENARLYTQLSSSRTA